MMHCRAFSMLPGCQELEEFAPPALHTASAFSAAAAISAAATPDTSSSQN